MNSNILILVLLLIIVIFAICNVKKNKVYIIPLIISLLGIFNYSSLFSTWSWFNDDFTASTGEIKTGSLVFDTVLTPTTENSVSVEANNHIEASVEYMAKFTNTGNSRGQIKITFGDKVYYTEAISAGESLSINIISDTSGEILFDPVWGSSNTPSVLDNNTLKIEN